MEKRVVLTQISKLDNDKIELEIQFQNHVPSENVVSVSVQTDCETQVDDRSSESPYSSSSSGVDTEYSSECDDEEFQSWLATDEENLLQQYSEKFHNCNELFTQFVEITQNELFLKMMGKNIEIRSVGVECKRQLRRHLDELDNEIMQIQMLKEQLQRQLAPEGPRNDTEDQHINRFGINMEIPQKIIATLNNTFKAVNKMNHQLSTDCANMTTIFEQSEKCPTTIGDDIFDELKKHFNIKYMIKLVEMVNRKRAQRILMADIKQNKMKAFTFNKFNVEAVPVELPEQLFENGAVEEKEPSSKRAKLD